jgi:hypothetical protein
MSQNYVGDVTLFSIPILVLVEMSKLHFYPNVSGDMSKLQYSISLLVEMSKLHFYPNVSGDIKVTFLFLCIPILVEMSKLQFYYFNISGCDKITVGN